VGYQISTLVGFGGLQDFKNIQFWFITSFAMTVGFVLLREISMMVGFGGLRDLNDGRICWVMRFQ